MPTTEKKNDRATEYVKIPKDTLEEALHVLMRNANRISERGKDLIVVEKSLRWDAACTQIWNGADSEAIANAAKWCEEASLVGAHADDLEQKAHERREAVKRLRQYL